MPQRKVNFMFLVAENGDVFNADFVSWFRRLPDATFKAVSNGAEWVITKQELDKLLAWQANK